MLHKLAEEWHDTLLYLGAVFGLLAFFLCYWKGEYQNRYAELVMQEFLSEVTVSGIITLEEYETLADRLQDINTEYEMDISCVTYKTEPVYALIPEEEIVSYYMAGNVQQATEFTEYEPVCTEEQPESLHLQKESNAELIASADQKLGLPKEEDVWRIEALKPVQKIYAGENLITLCRISSSEGEYYAEAEPVTAENSGTVHLKLWLENREYQIPVQVECYPRIVTCENGHAVVNSENILSKDLTIGKVICPYCKIVPSAVSCNTGFLWKKTGTNLSGQEVWLNVTYMNGDTEIVTPDSLEWQDSFDKNYCGIQNVTVNYRGKEDNLQVITENLGCRKCDRACNERSFSDYTGFPYCTKCMSQTELFSGRVHTEEIIISEDELIAGLDEKKSEYFQMGDLVRLYLTKGGKYVTYVQAQVKQDGKMRKEK